MSPIAELSTRQHLFPSTTQTKTFHGLSEYFPQHNNTAYFYSFPAGQDSSFFNRVPTWIEELVAARSLVCAGSTVRPAVFAPSLDPLTWDIVTQRFGTELISRDRAVGMSPEITSDVVGAVRNVLIRRSLAQNFKSRELVMAQPFTDDFLTHIYQIPPQLTVMLNDKANRSLYMPSKYIPKILGKYPSGAAFQASTEIFDFPCVMKVSSSSSGDGVRICMNASDLRLAKEEFKTMNGTIIIEQHIRGSFNLCIQFGIPADCSKPIEMLGYNEQLTSENGAFLAGIVNPYKVIPGLQNVYNALASEVLPNVRSLGWYGVGGIDVLIVDENEFYFIDTNFRMTATFTFVHLQRTGRLPKPVVSFAGTYAGSYDDFFSKIVPLGKNGHPDQIMTVIALTQRSGLFRFNAGLSFDSCESLRDNVERLLDLGIESGCLDALVASVFRI